MQTPIWLRFLKPFWILVLFVNLIESCSAQELTAPSKHLTSPTSQAKLTSQETPMVITNATVGWNKNLMVDNVPYDLYIPANYGEASEYLLPCLLVLPGWNVPRNVSVDKTSLVEYAEQYGYALILPEMGQNSV